ncbi:MAG: type III-A CRISPR-associated RAMP protein Csm3 [Desulfobacteraceae bacterium]|nr:type III-A CRISPR-associated RAMP protein Csm3 [Desulfobacteraceae bacterium]
MKLINIKEIKGTITLKSGLHIGAGDTEIKIGGTDNPVVKHPHTDEPYIPGSSLKGKIRSLLEMRSGQMGKTGGDPLGFKHLKDLEGAELEECKNIIKLFGASGADEDKYNIGPCRASFADCPIAEDWKKQAVNDHLAFSEVKSENSINRIKGTASNPRFIERVPSGVEFSFSISLKNLEENENLEDLLLQGIKLLEMDALGGSGSRGYGQVKFSFDNKELQKKFESIEPF